ncbi:MAG: hypothetical protein WC943_15370, partial [Elusimicrobiota bacterium]
EGGPALFLFPDEAHPGFRLPNKTLHRLCDGYSVLYAALVEAAVSPFRTRLGLPEAAGRVLGREALVPIAHFYLDRLVRLAGIAASFPGLSVFSASEPVPNDLSRFRALTRSSLQFNQAVLVRHARTLGLAVVEPPAPLIDPPAVPARSGANFNIGAARTAERIRRRLFSAGKKGLAALGLAPGPVPVLSMAYNTEALKSAGFYGGLLESVQNRARLVDAPMDPALRAELAGALASAAGAVAAFLETAGFDDPAAGLKAARGLADFAAVHFPTLMLEAGPANVRTCAAVLAPFAPKPLLLSETNTPEPTFMMAAARTLGMEVVGVQYGGHQGYIEHHSPAADGHLPFMDRYVTWGWERMPKPCASVRAVPLPSPWLSERRRCWSAALSGPRARTHDVLLMTNRLYRFPPAPSGVSTVLPDQAEEALASIVELVRACAREGLSVLHKPYAGTPAWTGRCIREAQAAGGSFYHKLDSPDKGMDPETLRSVSCVLWDVPGTGLVECLASDIPSIAYWPRIHSREEAAAEDLFRELESSGLVPRTLPALMAGLMAVKASPEAWLADRARKAAAARFLRAYAWADPDWAVLWRGFLKSL